MITNILDFIGYRSLDLSHKLQGHQVHPPDSWRQYIKDDTQEFLRITYPLTPTSLVVDLGGFKGEWSQQIYCRYRCNIDIYEPHPVNAAVIAKRFEFNPSIKVFPFALSNRNALMDLHGNDIYSSLYESSGETCEVVVWKASTVFDSKYRDSTIDLLKINIEGSEYDVLPDLIANYQMTNVRNIQIQFHNTIQGHVQKRTDICRDLAKTHVRTWCYDYLYENWQLKG